jgi:hypothetical protein
MLCTIQAVAECSCRLLLLLLACFDIYIHGHLKLHILLTSMLCPAGLDNDGGTKENRHSLHTRVLKSSEDKIINI